MSEWLCLIAHLHTASFVITRRQKLCHQLWPDIKPYQRARTFPWDRATGGWSQRDGFYANTLVLMVRSLSLGVYLLVADTSEMVIAFICRAFAQAGGDWTLGSCRMVRREPQLRLTSGVLC